MNAQNTQNLQNCLQSEVLYLCDSTFDRTLGRIINVINAARNQYARQRLSALFSSLPRKQLRDIGFDDPAVQMQLFGSNLNVQASLRSIDPNRNLMR